MKLRKPRERWLSVGDVAALAGVSVDTVRNWDRPGLLPARRTDGGQRRWLLGSVERFLNGKRGLSPSPAHPQPTVASELVSGRIPSKAEARPIKRILEDISPWQEEVEEAEAEVKFLNARRAAQAVRRSMDEEAKNIERRSDAERQQRENERRLDRFKADGRAFARNLPAEYQAKVVADLQGFVTPQQFPSSLSDTEAWAFIQARVLRVRDRYLEAERQKQERQREKEAQERRREEKERRLSQIARLIIEGEAVARARTIWWGSAECRGASQAVRDELEARVEWDWSAAEVNDLVTEFLNRWEDDDEDDDRDEGDEDDEANLGDEDDDDEIDEEGDCDD